MNLLMESFPLKRRMDANISQAVPFERADLASSLDKWVENRSVRLESLYPQTNHQPTMMIIDYIHLDYILMFWFLKPYYHETNHHPAGGFISFILI